MIWNEDKYTVKEKTPAKHDFTKMFVYKCGQVLVNDVPASCFVDTINQMIDEEKILCALLSFTGTIGQSIADLKNAGYVVEMSFDEEGYKAEMQAIRIKRNELMRQYREDLFADCEIESNIGNTLFDRAMDENHSSGMHAVETEFSELVTLFNVCYDLRQQNESERSRQQL